MSLTPRNREYCTLLTEGREVGMHFDVSTNNRDKLWDYGIVPYIFNGNVSNELKDIAMGAMREFHHNTVIRFVERTNQSSYIEIIDDETFASYVGSRRKRQELYITKDETNWPNTKGSIMHELMHALGFYHEHCRPDRNNHVNVGENTGTGYDRLNESDVFCFGPYDFESIMHYSEDQGVTLNPGIEAEIGQRERLSEGDKEAIRRLYPYTQGQLHILYGDPNPFNNCREDRSY